MKTNLGVLLLFGFILVVIGCSEPTNNKDSRHTVTQFTSWSLDNRAPTVGMSIYHNRHWWKIKRISDNQGRDGHWVELERDEKADPSPE